MKNNIKKVLAVNDVSGIGRCSFSVISPILSILGHQASVLPTSVLSTQTWGFEGYTFTDLTDCMEKHYEHLKREGISFDAVYTGFFGNPIQFDIAERIIKDSKDSLILVDPVMGDDGILYSTYTEDMRMKMKNLVALADVITPNVTEAALLLDMMPKKSYKDKDIELIYSGLRDICHGDIVITGIEECDKVKTAYLKNGKIKYVAVKRVDKLYPGTGDIFASVLLGNILKGRSLESSVKRASRFVMKLALYSSKFDYHEREGVLLEAKLRELR